MEASEQPFKNESRNLWQALPAQPPYVLTSDRPYLDAYNATLKPDDEDHRIFFDYPPEPFLGLRSTPVVVLSCNPAFSPEAAEQFAIPGFKDAALANLVTPDGIPIYPLEDQFKDTPGGRWWRRRLKGLLSEEHDYSNLARLVSSIEFHGYWSKNWEAPLVTLPSQHYGFELVSQAMERRATIVLARAERYWKQVVPALGNYDRLVTTRTPRVSALSEGNLSPEHFKMVLASLTNGER
jgi:hypothetical protein